MGFMMFGESTESQFTLNMPQDLVASKIAVWTTVGQLKFLVLIFFYKVFALKMLLSSFVDCNTCSSFFLLIFTPSIVFSANCSALNCCI